MQALVLFSDRSRNIDHGQNREHESLQNRYENMQKYERNGTNQWNDCSYISQFAEMSQEEIHFEHQPEKQNIERLAHEHIDPKTYGKRKQAGQVADDFDRKHDRRHCQHRTQEVLAMPERPMFHDTDPVVIDE